MTSGERVGALLSVNVGMPKDVTWHGRTVHTAVWKKPVAGPRMVRRLNIDGDGQGDLAGHGGEQRAVFVYQIESYRYWQQELGRDDFEYGQFGENFTVQGLADDQVCIGDRYQIGDAVFEVTQPRVTCFRVGIRMDDPQLPALLVSRHRPGFYFRVLTEGPSQCVPGWEVLVVESWPDSGGFTAAFTQADLCAAQPPIFKLRSEEAERGQDRSEERAGLREPEEVQDVVGVVALHQLLHVHGVVLLRWGWEFEMGVS